jgi:molybdopterin converting factor subunit 1
MEVRVRFFATLRDHAGVEETHLRLEDPATVSSLLEQLGDRYPRLRPSLDTALVAVNREYVFAENPIREGDEVALFPPVSGGSWPELFSITTDPFDIDSIIAHLTSEETGAACVFTGLVRGLTDAAGAQRQTNYLHYEAYEPMAEAKLRQVASEIRERYPAVQGIAIVQRIGRLDVGSPTVLIACTSGHRNDGVFEAARYGIDRLKEIVPVWKKEIGPDGAHWVEGSYHPGPDDVRHSGSK